MSAEDCIRAFRAQAGEGVTDAEMTEFIEALDVHTRHMLAANPGITPEQAARMAATDTARRAQIAAMVEKRNAAINHLRRMEVVGYIANTFGNNAAQGIEAVLLGVQRAKQGARNSVAATQAALSHYYTAGFLNAIERAGLKRAFASGAMDQDVARALWWEGKPDAPELPADAKALAKIVRKWQELARADANNAGAWIGKRDDYIIRQSHDSAKIHRAGFDAWAAMAREAFDIPRMMMEHGVLDADKMLKAEYANLSTGNHLKEVPDGVASAFKGPGNLAKKLSQSRSIHFKGPDEFMKYNEAFGFGNLRESIVSGLHRSAQSTGLMRHLGTNPGAMMKTVADDLSLMLKAAGKLDQVNAIDADKTDKMLSMVDGRANIPGNPTAARWSANIRGVQLLAKLGGMVLSQAGDLATFAMGARYQGRGFFSGMHEAVSGLGRSLAAQERRDLAASLGVVLDNMAGELGRIGSMDESAGMQKAMRLFMKANLSEWWTNRMRTSAAFGMADYMARQAGKDWAALGDDYRRVFGLYGITEAEWKVIRTARQTEVDGQAFITPEGMRSVSDDVMRGYIGQAATDAEIARERRALEDKLRTYYTDQTASLALEGDAKTRMYTTQGARPGTVLGEMMRFLMQFKSFAFAFTQRVIGRELFGRGYEGSSIWGALRAGNGEMQGLAALVVSTTLMGYASMSLKDLAKGRTPRDPTESPGDAVKVFTAAALQGGGFGIYGDFLFGQASRAGSGTIETLAGPVLSTAGRAVDLYHKALAGDDVAARSLNLAISNTPFANLFYTRMALDYLILYQVQESINPGYLRRMEREVEKNNAQTFLIRPSEIVR